MADVKWSNNTSFPIQLGFGAGDHIMGLTAGNLNAKYPVSLITAKVSGPSSAFDNTLPRYDGTTGKLIKGSSTSIDDSGNMLVNGNIRNTTGDIHTITGRLLQPERTPTQYYISSAGDDTLGNAQIINPYLTVTFADGVALAGTGVFISLGPHIENSISKKADVSWYGQGIDNTGFSSVLGPGVFGLDDGSWTGGTNPKIDINNITLLAAGGFVLKPSAYKTNSSMIFRNVKTSQSTNDFSTGNYTNLVMTGGESDNLNLNDIVNIYIENRTITGPVFISSLDSANVTVINVILRNCIFNDAITLTTGYGGAASFNVKIQYCSGITQILHDDGSFSISSTLEVDANNYPNIIDLSGGLTVLKTTNVADGIDTTAGFSLGKEFSWSGHALTSPHTLVAGDGAHITSGNRNILLGNWSTSSKNGCFVWSDGTATSLANHFPTADNQANFYAAGGFGIGTNNSGGVEGPQAGFHYAHNYGNDGKFLFSAFGIVADGNMHNSELNPYITSDQLFIKQKGSSGTVSLYTFPSGSASLAPLASPTFFGTVAISAPNVSLGKLQFTPANNAGNYAITVVNASFGQATTITIPDPAASSASFSMTKAALVVGNFVKANTTTGIIEDSGITNSDLVHRTGNETILGDKDFDGNITIDFLTVVEIANPLVSNCTPVDITATTATLTALQFVGSVITLNPTLAQTLTTPTASDIDTILDTPSTDRAFDLLFVNQSSVATIIVGGTNVSTAGCYLTAGSVVIPASSQRRFRISRTSSTPSYAMFG